jgi:adenine-specific DNA-methyltransferase
MGTKRPADDDYVMQPMFTYMGNKRSLLPFIRQAVESVCAEIGRPIRALDLFCGSTVVARMLAAYCSELHTNDLEPYSCAAANCFLQQPTDEQRERVTAHLAAMNALTVFSPGITCDMYAPQDTNDVQPNERCFFTRENAMRVDTWRKYVEDHVEDDVKSWCLVPILVQMSIRANSMGHFKSFLKSKDNVGSFDPVGKRATDPMVLLGPVFNPSTCKVTCHNEDAVSLMARFATAHEATKPFDLIYLDPPYTASVEYGAFYFLLNVVLSNVRPTIVNKVTGLPKERVKSDFNSKLAVSAMQTLVDRCVASSLVTLVSYNDEGIVTAEDWNRILEPYDAQLLERDYKRYGSNRGVEKQGSRTEVKERLYVIRAKTAVA